MLKRKGGTQTSVDFQVENETRKRSSFRDRFSVGKVTTNGATLTVGVAPFVVTFLSKKRSRNEDRKTDPKSVPVFFLPLEIQRQFLKKLPKQHNEGI